MKRSSTFFRVIPCAFDNTVGESKACWVITRRCNYSCAHCCTNSGPSVRETDLQQINEVVDDIVSQGIRRVIISGGEPLVSSSILDIISHCAERGLRTSISTNGSLLTENYISLLKSAGLSKVTLSLDGPPEEHEDLRCHLGAYQKAIAAARMIYAEKMPFSVNCLVRSDLTTPSVKELFALTKAYHAEELTFTFPMLVGRMRRLSASWDKTWEEESKWLRDLSTFAETYRQITTAFVPKCGTETCSSKKLIFGKVPESSSLGGCVYLQYTAAELGADNEPKLVPTYNRSAATQILP